MMEEIFAKLYDMTAFMKDSAKNKVFVVKRIDRKSVV